MQRLITAYTQGNLEVAIRNAQQKTIINFCEQILSVSDVSLDNLRIIVRHLSPNNHSKIINPTNPRGEYGGGTSDIFKNNLRKLLTIVEFTPNFSLDNYVHYDFFDILLTDNRFYSNDTLSLLIRRNVPDRVENYLNSDKFTGIDLPLDFIERFKLYKYSLSLILGHEKVNLPVINKVLLKELCEDIYIKEALKKKMTNIQ